MFFCSSTNAQIFVLDFNPPFRLKNLQAFINADNQTEKWSVGGQGSLSIISGEKQIDKRISEADLSSIFFVNDSSIFVAGTGGELLVSENRGESWRKIELETKTDLTSIFCLTQDKCWAVGAKDGTLFSGGISDKWKTENIVSNGELNDVYFINEKTGFIVGRKNLILKTTDGGINWRRIGLSYETRVAQFIDGMFQFEYVSFLNDKIGCVTGWGMANDIVACTQDQGKTWKVNLLENVNFTGIVWKSKKEVYLVEEYGKNHISTDAGISWKPVTGKNRNNK